MAVSTERAIRGKGRLLAVGLAAAMVGPALAFQVPTTMTMNAGNRIPVSSSFISTRSSQLLLPRLSSPYQQRTLSMLLTPAALPTFATKKDAGRSLVALRTGTLATGASEPPKVNRLLLGFYFLAWYVLNVGYNIYVKRTLNVLPLPFTFAVVQLGAGAVWLLPQFLTGIRKVPKPSPSNVKALTKVAAFHGAGQLATVVAMGLGSISFVNVVKALEPIFTAAIGVLVTGIALPWQVWLSMFPVCAGVGLASISELSFTWGCFGCAMLSNLVYASRAVSCAGTARLISKLDGQEGDKRAKT